MSHATGELVSGHLRQALGVCVRDIGANTAVEVDVGEAGNDIAPGHVHPTVLTILYDLSTLQAHILDGKASLRVKDLSTRESHRQPALRRTEKAASSPTPVTLGCS